MLLANQNLTYQLGWLHFAHLLAAVDGHIDERERKPMREIQVEEEISDLVFSNLKRQ